MIDGLLRRLGSRAMRRGTAGDYVWLLVAAAVWLVRRELRQGPPVVWSGSLRPGQQLVITSRRGDAVGTGGSGGTGDTEAG